MDIVNINQQEEPIVRSAEIEDIISQTPSWINRWGTTLIFFWIFFLLVLSCFIDYPDIIRADVVITTNPPPLTIQTKSSGNLHLLTLDNQKVNTGDIVAYIESSVRFQDVIKLENLLQDHNVGNVLLQEANFHLGELQNLFSAFVRSVNDQQNFESLDITDKQIKQLESQLGSYRALKSVLAQQLHIGMNELRLAEKKFHRDSILYSQNVLSELDFNNAQASLLQEQRDFRNSETNLINNQIQINALKSQVTQLLLQHQQERSRLEWNVVNSKKELVAGIEKWKEMYVLIAPQEGSISYLKFLDNAMYIEASEKVISILPLLPDDLILYNKANMLYAQATIPITGSGKVLVGQLVNIRLKNFPHEQFGMLKGKVIEISAVPTGDSYLAKISLTDNLITTHGKKLPFKQQLQGSTEIITEELSIFQRTMYQFRTLVSNQF